MKALEKIEALGRKFPFKGLLSFLIYGGILLLSTLFFTLLFMRVMMKGGEEVEVPNLGGKSIASAWDELSQLSLEMKKGQESYDPFVPQGHVISQEPLPGTLVKEGRAVEVVISKGSQLVVVPEVVGQDLRRAKVILARAGLKPGRLSYIYFHEKRGTVLAQGVLPMEETTRDSSISLLISKGPRPGKFILPNLVGLSVDEASSLLKNLNLEVANIEAKVDLSRPYGIILMQSPEPGSILEEAEGVNLVISVPEPWTGIEKSKVDVLHYQAPMGFFKKSLRITLLDTKGLHEIYNEQALPGTELFLPVKHQGPGIVKIFLEDMLAEERSYP